MQIKKFFLLNAKWKLVLNLGAGEDEDAVKQRRWPISPDDFDTMIESRKFTNGADKDEVALAFLRDLKDRSELLKLLSRPAVTGAAADLMWENVVALQKAGAATSEEIQSKCAGANEGEYQGIETFFGGLEAFVGSPNPEVEEGMEAEHRERPDSTKQFLRSMSKPDKPKYATPAQEWEIVVAPVEGKNSDLGLTMILTNHDLE